MIKAFIKHIINYFTYLRLNKKAIMNRNVFINRRSKITLIDGSTKKDVVFGENIMYFGKIISSNKGKIKIGNNTSIRLGCIFYCAKGITIGNNVMIADNVIISDTNHHPINPQDRLKMIKSGWSSKLWSWDKAISKEIIIGNNVWIGQFSRILKGVNIGENSIIASNSIVTKDVPPNSIAAGNPAKIVKENIHLLPHTL